MGIVLECSTAPLLLVDAAQVGNPFLCSPGLGDCGYSYTNNSSMLPFLVWQAIYCRANKVQLVFRDINRNSFFGFYWGILNYSTFVYNIIKVLVCWIIQSFCHNATILFFPISSTLETVCITSLSMITLVSRLNRSPLSSRYGFSMSSNTDTKARTYLANLFWIPGYCSLCLWDFSLSLLFGSSFQIEVRPMLYPAKQSSTFLEVPIYFWNITG